MQEGYRNIIIQAIGTVCPEEEYGSLNLRSLTNDTSFGEDLKNMGVDSLDIVEIVQTIEETLDMDIPDEDFLTLKTIGELADYLAKREEN